MSIAEDKEQLVSDKTALLHITPQSSQSEPEWTLMNDFVT
jgi:hypothetical protein